VAAREGARPSIFWMFCEKQEQKSMRASDHDEGDTKRERNPNSAYKYNLPTSFNRFGFSPTQPYQSGCCILELYPYTVKKA